MDCFPPYNSINLKYGRGGKMENTEIVNGYATKAQLSMQIPSSYRPGYDRVRPSNPELADRYIEHTTIGDPVADALVQELHGLNQNQVHQYISTLMDGDKEKSRQAPEALRQFFRNIETPPEWYYSVDVLPGCGLFHKYSDLFLTAFVVSVIIRGFTTLISRSFFATGRVIDFGVRRLRQNIAHLLEIMIPGGLDPQGDGWKLSIRIRLVHAQLRKLLTESDEWNTSAHGIPLSSAHIGYAAASFSAMMLQDAMKLGVKASAEARASFMHIWRCSAYLMGVPDAMLFRDEEHAMEIVRVSLATEPPFHEEGIVMANALINSAPIVSGIQDSEERAKLVKLGYRLARVILGHENADKLEFPRYPTFGFLPYLKTMYRLHELTQRFPLLRSEHGITKKFGTLLDMTLLEDSGSGFSYRLPDHYIADLSSKW